MCGMSDVISSQADFLASHIAQPGSAEARQMTVRSGLKCAELLRTPGQLGCLVKMLLESSTWNSTVCFLIWKPSATPRGRLLFRLSPVMPNTDETGCGYLLPTPTANQAPNKNANTNGPKTTEEVARSDWMPGKVWPTPKATAAGADFAKLERSKTGISLQTAVRLWPTMTAREYRNSRGQKEDGRAQDNLAAKACKGTNPQDGCLNPAWVEWLMGYPIGHTVCEDSATPSCRKLRKR